jgi:hypothetical protein
VCYLNTKPTIHVHNRHDLYTRPKVLLIHHSVRRSGVLFPCVIIIRLPSHPRFSFKFPLFLLYKYGFSVYKVRHYKIYPKRYRWLKLLAFSGFGSNFYISIHFATSEWRHFPDMVLFLSLPLLLFIF